MGFSDLYEDVEAGSTSVAIMEWINSLSGFDAGLIAFGIIAALFAIVLWAFLGIGKSVAEAFKEHKKAK